MRIVCQKKASWQAKNTLVALACSHYGGGLGACRQARHVCLRTHRHAIHRNNPVTSLKKLPQHQERTSSAWTCLDWPLYSCLCVLWLASVHILDRTSSRAQKEIMSRVCRCAVYDLCSRTRQPNTQVTALKIALAWPRIAASTCQHGYMIEHHILQNAWKSIPNGFVP